MLVRCQRERQVKKRVGVPGRLPAKKFKKASLPFPTDSEVDGPVRSTYTRPLSLILWTSSIPVCPARPRLKRVASIRRHLARPVRPDRPLICLSRGSGRLIAHQAQAQPPPLLRLLTPRSLARRSAAQLFQHPNRRLSEVGLALASAVGSSFLTKRAIVHPRAALPSWQPRRHPVHPVHPPGHWNLEIACPQNPPIHSSTPAGPDRTNPPSSNLDRNDRVFAAPMIALISRILQLLGC